MTRADLAAARAVSELVALAQLAAVELDRAAAGRGAAYRSRLEDLAADLLEAATAVAELEA